VGIPSNLGFLLLHHGARDYNERHDACERKQRLFRAAAVWYLYLSTASMYLPFARWHSMLLFVTANKAFAIESPSRQPYTLCYLRRLELPLPTVNIRKSKGYHKCPTEITSLSRKCSIMYAQYLVHTPCAHAMLKYKEFEVAQKSGCKCSKCAQ